jgi:hypothetical protein
MLIEKKRIMNQKLVKFNYMIEDLTKSAKLITSSITEKIKKTFAKGPIGPHLNKNSNSNYLPSKTN